jgi:hypothetical protein
VKRLFRIGIRPSSGLDYAEFLTSLPDQKIGRTSTSQCHRFRHQNAG